MLNSKSIKKFLVFQKDVHTLSLLGNVKNDLNYSQTKSKLNLNNNHALPENKDSESSFLLSLLKHYAHILVKFRL